MFYFDEIDGKKVLKSDLITNAQAFFTTRELCICDKAIHSNLQQVKNSKTLKPIQNDRIFEIENNKHTICNYLTIDYKNLITPEQTHSANINIAIKDKVKYPKTDALILTDTDLAIFLNFADCTPIILYDEKQNIGAVAHAGWRGTAQKIAPLTVKKMIKDFGSEVKNIVAVIGPAIGFCCYNVGQEVYEKLSETVNNFTNLSEIREGNIFVDLKNINRQQLIEIGIDKIDVCSYCTVHNNDKFFSYRNENATTNRHSAVLKLR